MASRRSVSNGDAWIRAYGEKIGVQLGQQIAKSLQRTLESKLDLAIAKHLGAAGGRAGAGGGRKARGSGGCSAAGCPNQVLAQGLCRSHYYKARYRAQKGGAKPSRRK